MYYSKYFLFRSRTEYGLYTRFNLALTLAYTQTPKLTCQWCRDQEKIIIRPLFLTTSQVSCPECSAPLRTHIHTYIHTHVRPQSHKRQIQDAEEDKGDQNNLTSDGIVWTVKAEETADFSKGKRWRDRLIDGYIHTI